MGDSGVNLAGIGLVTAGAILAWSAINDPEKGPVGVIQSLLTGNAPTPGYSIGSTVGAFATDLTGKLVDASIRGVVSVAQTYLGDRFLLGGASHKGIDCSGLVMVAYRDGAGIQLPHRATLQAARARLVPRDQAMPGDLVCWGVPGNYPHIAIVTDAETCIAAWTWGVPVGYDKIDIKAVPGFGYPDIRRVVG